MDSMILLVSSIQFKLNLVTLKQQMRQSLPSDCIVYHCKNCHVDLPFNTGGMLEIENHVEKPIGKVVENLLNCFLKRHEEKNQQCSRMIVLHPEGLPKNILISFPESKEEYMKGFQIADESYKLKLTVKKEDDVVFVLYQSENYEEDAYFEFLKCNFDAFLNKSKDEMMNEEYVYDDESFHHFQHYLPRITGGGRKLNADFNYECIWCPKEVIKLGKRGRFREITSYRKHFRQFHLGEDSNGIPMTEFLEKVQRVEPTWFCERCKQHYSLGNKVRHKAICKSDESSTDCEDEDLRTTNSVKKKYVSQKKTMHKKKKFCLYDTSSDENEEHKRKDELAVSNEPKEHLPRESGKKIKAVNIDYRFVDIEDEVLYSPSGDNNGVETGTNQMNDSQLEIEVHISNEIQQNEGNVNKWWLKVPKHLYGDMGMGGPKIFLPSDSEEFIKRCTERYNIHITKKLQLDQNMKEAESPSAQLLQFSEVRDKPILEKYTDFVRTSSAKDVLHIFSEDYEQLNLPTGAKSSTAGQYTNRIIEFFKFMARKYRGFHLDWFLDFKGEIEKVYPDGNKNDEIFLPTKDDLTDFIKQFKYGGNISCIIYVIILKIYFR